MLISTKYQFVFICVPKCASTAIEAALRRHSNLILGGHPILKHTSFLEYQEHFLPYLVEKLGELPRQYACMALFREPLDWLFSWYAFRSRPQLAAPNNPQHASYTGHITFEEFVREHCRRKRKRYAHIPHQYEYVQDRHGRVDGLQLFRYENIDRFLEEISERVGNKITLQPRNASPKREQTLSAAVRKHAENYLSREYEIYDAL